MMRVLAPGLPQWPPLMFEEAKNRAFVTARVPSWKSYELGLQISEWVALFNLGLCVILGFSWMPDFELSFLGPVVSLILSVVIGLPTTKWIRCAMPGVLARQFLAKRISFWFTGNAIAFRSSLYRNGVSLPRSVDGVPFSIQFSIDEDQGATAAFTDLKPERTFSKAHFGEARRLNMIVRHGQDERSIPDGDAGIVRTIPVCELMSGALDQLIVVCKAAQLLTESSPEKRSTVSTVGVDIDQI